MGKGNTLPLHIKYTYNREKYNNFDPMKPTPKSFGIPNQQYIVDKQ